MDMHNLLTTVEQLLCIIILGYILRWKDVLTKTGIRELSGLAVNITCPLLVIASVCQMENSDMNTILYLLFWGTAIYISLPFLSVIFTKVFRIINSEKGCYQFMLIFSNTSLLGFPVVQALFGNEAVFYTALLHIPFDILVYSYGFYIMKGENEHNIELSSDFVKQLWNPGLVLTVLALTIYLLEIKLPTVLSDTCYIVGNLTTPLSMIIIGASLYEIKLADIFRVKELYIMSIFRLLIIPLAIYTILVACTDLSDMLVGIATITFGMPVGSMIVMIANDFSNNTELAVKSVSLTTVLAVVTVPVLVLVLV